MTQREQSRRPAPDRKLQIGVNLLWLVPGDVGGTEEYAARLLMPFAEIDDIKLTLFCRPSLPSSRPELGAAGQFVVAPLPGKNRVARVVVERTWLHRASRDLDLVHHLGGTMPRRLRCPGVLTVHDLQPLDAPELFSSYKARWLQWAIPASVRAAKAIMTPSRFVADGVIERFGFDPARVYVVPAHSGASAAAMSADDAIDRSVLSNYGLARAPYVLYPAITYPHKNHVVLLRALARMTELGHRDLHLVFTGRADAAQHDLEREIERNGLSGRVHCLGRVPAHDFAVIFRHARVLGFPSRYEGFGLPAIEAMARGIPVVAADVTALPEVVGDAGILVSPDDVDGWVQALRDVAAASELRGTIVHRGYERAKDFGASACAARLAEIYRATVAGLPAA